MVMISLLGSMYWNLLIQSIKKIQTTGLFIPILNPIIMDMVLVFIDLIRVSILVAMDESMLIIWLHYEHGGLNLSGVFLWFIISMNMEDGLIHFMMNLSNMWCWNWLVHLDLYTFQLLLINIIEIMGRMMIQVLKRYFIDLGY
jgi:hypothetical protein